MIDGERLGFIGGGNMAEALIRGALAAGAAKPDRIVVYDVAGDRCAKLRRELGVMIATDNADVVRSAGVLLLAVKPQNLAGLLGELSGLSRADQLWITFLAGIPAARVEAGLAHPGCAAPRVVRAMPNTPALVLAGATALAPGRHATDADLARARAIFETVGRVEVVEEELMDAITGLTGSGPAYVFRMIESLIEAGVSQGIERGKAERLVKQMVHGAALMARDSTETPAELRRRVTSPKGTTAEGLGVLEERGFERLIVDAVAAAARRSKELGRQG